MPHILVISYKSRHVFFQGLLQKDSYRLLQYFYSSHRGQCNRAEVLQFKPVEHLCRKNILELLLELGTMQTQLTNRHPPTPPKPNETGLKAWNLSKY